MTDPDFASTTAASSRAAESWTTWIAWDLLPRDTRESLVPLFGFLAAVRAVADHPALSAERKEAALAALAAPFSDNGVPPEAEGQWSEAAQALAAQLSARGIESPAPWQILQAAGQDLRKTRYRDWSDLLMWCRFGAAPAAALAFRLTGADVRAAPSAEKLGIALQLIEIARRAASHYAWLGRVYLPERWFAEARCDTGDLGFAQISEPLQTAIGRALDQAEALLDEGMVVGIALSGFHQRRAFHAAMIEARRDVTFLRRRTAWSKDRPRMPRLAILLRATWRALTRR